MNLPLYSTLHPDGSVTIPVRVYTDSVTRLTIQLNGDWSVAQSALCCPALENFTAGLAPFSFQNLPRCVRDFLPPRFSEAFDRIAFDKAMEE